MYSDRYQAYKQQSVMTMTGGEMLHMLYDGVIKDLTRAKLGFGSNDYTEINTQLKKAQEILLYLKKILDHQYPIANNLESLYNYFIKVLRTVNVKKDPKELDTIIGFVRDLRDTFDKADRAARTKDA